ncbi:glutamine--fructose-6-phosphate transaminase (isomerizing) [Taylorella equigenitalis]|uniref:Glutamine--fructose-6-phosphate aminotransferase [isomerizing] n=1 Tax=Taylorella equigenitalis ATCC 35865 TaxID=743973 RepID=A0ABN4B023_9BURK|nr:glutamine--fructose-6-phosphate transaminase (isomerizing) [Taylorella equigenitalis]AFN36529.1 glucosamine--fructose-6-phosphate aminotransferase [isomerizing] [Taylorella equigenitalis ATCC 35865]ASY39929.1 glutamine--fructose-6-phosphate aminotransferase [Taylorella equigenitalis]VEG32646.1 Glucosamine--fructose-6-phosphate aminotransferase [isomerizing] [Taylorella equigenitalis ATCC 35865]
MCGIVGGISNKSDVTPILIQGLKRLEYRGYDSCGVAVLQNGELRRTRSTQRVHELENQVKTEKLEGCIGIAHTRWATHGAPETYNAHPHFSSKDDSPFIGLVHNGIIENYESLKEELSQKGVEFESQTDTEVIAHLIKSLYKGNLFDAVKEATKLLKGAYALAIIAKSEPEVLVVARKGSPLVIGLGGANESNYVASDALALAGVTSDIIYLEEGDVAFVSTDSVQIVDENHNPVERKVSHVNSYTASAELGPYSHYMQKEIFEQPRAVSDTLQNLEVINPELFGEGAAEIFNKTQKLLILGCGTSYHAGMVAKYWIESIVKIPVEVEIASEYRYRESVPNPNNLVVAISQSGETADTLAALNHARSMGMENTLTICNVSTSAMVRECKLNFITRAGVEIGVASTKAFTTQLVGLFILTICLAQSKNKISEEQTHSFIKQLRHLPVAISSILALEPQIIAWSEKFAPREHALFLGRGVHYPIAKEGALKLKEISYIHAEAYPAGELKHGPLALVTKEMPVVVIAPNDNLLEKLKSNMQEVKARGGQLYVLADADTHITPVDGMHVIRMPEHYGHLSPILHTVPLQLLAYHTALARGTDVDKPRNLAKSVTVE